MNKKSTILDLILSLWDPFWLLPSSFRLRIEQEETKWINNAAIVNFTLWPLNFIAFHFIFDQSKTPIEPWIYYRFGTALTIATLGAVAYTLRKHTNIVKFLLYLAALTLSIAVSISMSFGYQVQMVWVTIFPTIILMTVSRSFILSTLWLMFIVLITKPLWINQMIHIRWIISNTEFPVIFLLLGHLTRRVWITSKVNQILNEDLIAVSIEKQIEFDKHIKSFISPVLVSRIEQKTRDGYNLIAALDDVLMRKKASVAVMFTDMRNFSTRSVDTDFVEKELVPSSSKIIDSSEENMGIAKQIGDAVFVYYSMEDPEEGLLRATKDAVVGCIEEKQRIKELGRQIPERFFSIAYGQALVGNMASFRHREATVIGSPANLAARMDSLTKEPSFQSIIHDGNKILLSKNAKELLQTFHDSFEFNEVNLENMSLIMKSFPDEKYIYLFPITNNNIERLNDLLKANRIKTIQAGA